MKNYSYFNVVQENQAYEIHFWKIACICFNLINFVIKSLNLLLFLFGHANLLLSNYKFVIVKITLTDRWMKMRQVIKSFGYQINNLFSKHCMCGHLSSSAKF